jgi:hypothetical protein
MGKPKKINFEIISDEHESYRILDEIRSEHHEETASARIALAWQKGIKPDTDGHIVLGKCVKMSDPQKQFIPFDFVIVLNRETYNDIRFTTHMKQALLHHEMLHAARSYDNEGEPKVDERGHPVWRTRQHDIQEFTEVVRIYGTYKRDLEQFAEALLKSKKPSLFKQEAQEEDDTVLSDDMAQAIQ